MCVRAVAAALVCWDSRWKFRPGSLEKRFICRQGTTVLAGFSDVGGLGVGVLTDTGTEGKLAVKGAGTWSLDGLTSGTVKTRQETFSYFYKLFSHCPEYNDITNAFICMPRQCYF